MKKKVEILSNKKRTMKGFVTGSTLLLISFFLNFFWESLHTPYLYGNHNFLAREFLNIILYVSVMDTVLIAGLYCVVALLWQSWSWLYSPTKYQLVLFSGGGFFLATIIEYRAVYLVQKWSYSSLMPTLFGIGLSPLVQLSITGIIALYITRMMLKK